MSEYTLAKKWRGLNGCEWRADGALTGNCLGMDTGAGVIIQLFHSGYPPGRMLVYLPGHAIVDKELVSKSMLEPDPNEPGVTMGDRVNMLTKLLEAERARHAQLLDAERKKTTEAQAQAKMLEDREASWKKEIASLNDQISYIKEEREDLRRRVRDLEAMNAISLTSEGGELSVADSPSGQVSLLERIGLTRRK